MRRLRFPAACRSSLAITPVGGQNGVRTQFFVDKQRSAKNAHMIRTSILDLAASGDLGSLCHDLSHDELRMLLGSPSDWGTQATQERADIWRYGDIEFHFINRKVYLIFSDHGDMTLTNGSLQIDPWILRRGLALEDFESALAEASIPYETVVHDFDPTQRIVTTISGARFTFTDDPDDDFSGLTAWSIQTRTEPAPSNGG
jgi:hypothetical protein